MARAGAGVLDDFMSDVSVESESDEELHVMDPSDPRAHSRQHLTVGSTREPAKKKQKQNGSRWDTDEGEDTGEKVVISIDQSNDEEEENNEQTPVIIDEDSVVEAESVHEAPAAVTTAETKTKLSKWAMARFLVPRSERKLPVIEEPPLEPLNDFILSDFSTRFRGETGNVVIKKHAEDDQGDEESDTEAKMQVGAPLFSSKSLAQQEREKENENKGKQNGGNASTDKNRKRRENRYFVTDLATKCFNCGQVGHMSSLCMNDKVFKPCYYCGLRGHIASNCPNLPCDACLQVGHEARNCTNRPLRLNNCGICGRIGHENEDCENVSNGFNDITCMVCARVGHLQCTPVPPPADRRQFCPNCAGKHNLAGCRKYVEPPNPNFSSNPNRAVMKCFVCQVPGHIAAECPDRVWDMDIICFNCGEPGHYASSCPESGSNDTRFTGRKRAREYEEEYDDMYDYGQESDNDHYYIPSERNNRSRKHKKPSGKGYARLDAALPTRPHSSSKNGDRRRGGGDRYRR